MPAIVDGDVTVFDSNAILLHLAEKAGRFLPVDAAERGPLLSWLMFVASGIGPFSGQAVHFRHFAPEAVPYARERYAYEVRRHYGVLDGHLSGRQHMVGDTYTIVDMSVWGWARMLPFVLGDNAWDKLSDVKRLHDEIAARPATQRALGLKDRFSFKAEMDDEARSHVQASRLGDLRPAGRRDPWLSWTCRLSLRAEALGIPLPDGRQNLRGEDARRPAGVPGGENLEGQQRKPE